MSGLVLTKYVSKSFSAATTFPRHRGFFLSWLSQDDHLHRSFPHLRRGSAARGTLMARAAEKTKPTIVLVHGAFANSSSWNRVVTRLTTNGCHAIAAANPRGASGPMRGMFRALASIQGPVVLVGHSYGGEVISVAADGAENVKALVFVAGLARGRQRCWDLGARFPTGTFGQSLAPPVPCGRKEGPLHQPGQVLA